MGLKEEYLGKPHFLRELLVEWLLTDYTLEEAQDQIDKATIRIEGDIITVFYDTGKKDILRIKFKQLH